MPASARALAAVCAGCVLAMAPVSAQDAQTPVTTAAYLLNFAKFAEWPQDILPPGAPLSLCTGDAPLAEVLPAVVEGKTVGTHPVIVSRIAPGGSSKHCAVLYAPGLDEKGTEALVSQSRDSSVLLVGDSDAFLKGGGAIRLFVKDGRTRFAVNLAAVERARLQISSKLLHLAKVVRE